MPAGTLWFYALIALAVAFFCYCLLAAEPMADEHANLIHLLFKH
ncbi:hypothetical protein GMSM_13950 [Geomonas sp. Red276]